MDSISAMIMKTNSNTTKLIILLCLAIFSYVSAFEYQVGGTKGWSVPPKNDSAYFNLWASHNRFLVGDSVRFMYKKDSVMEVTKEEYRDCKTNRPIFFFNSGNTVYELNHSGFFYFVSGVSGHCYKGQKLIIKVLEPGEEYSSHLPGDVGHKKSAASPSATVVTKLPFLIQFLVLCFVSRVFY